ncbi:MAG TPA: hypothetical protein VHD83_10575 [Puia sp.]|nr:hypothetical protein [Puia sp.]
MISKWNLQGVWIVLIVFGILAIVIVMGRQQVNYREKHPVYATGKITGFTKVARGEQYVLYTFQVDTASYEGRVPIKFCIECHDSCCKVGENVRVRYAEGDPANNDLVH